MIVNGPYLVTDDDELVVYVGNVDTAEEARRLLREEADPVLTGLEVDLDTGLGFPYLVPWREDGDTGKYECDEQDERRAGTWWRIDLVLSSTPGAPSEPSRRQGQER
jgi:hypothetical protein